MEKAAPPLGINIDYIHGPCADVPSQQLNNHGRSTFIYVSPEGTVKPEKDLGPGRDFLRKCKYDVTSRMLSCTALPYGDQCIEVVAVGNTSTSVLLWTFFISIEDHQKGRILLWNLSLSSCSCGKTLIISVVQLLLVMQPATILNLIIEPLLREQARKQNLCL